MESANIHHPLYEYELVGSSSSSLATTTHAWNTINSILSTNSLSSSCPNETTTSSLNPRQEVNSTSYSLLSSLSYSPTSMAPDSSLNYWSNPNFIISQSAEDLQISRIKEDIYYLKYNELINNSPSSSGNDQEPSQLIRSEQRINHLQLPNDHHLSTKLLLKSFSSGNFSNKAHEGDQLPYSSSGGKGYNQVFPSVPVSSLLNKTGFNISQGPSLDMNLEALDLLSSSRFSGSFMNSSLENPVGMLRDGFSYGFGQHMQQESNHQFPIYNSINDKIPSSSNGVAEAKRNSSKMDSSKPMNQTSTKKPRSETRASCPPLKVRKEKLGDRIAALQQLVAPFGKTDTASVLMEAIGYIKFLQNQVETLSVPYMKAARNKSHRSMIKEDPIENKELEEKGQKRDLKSRGLCLVPMSCLSYITDGGGGGGGGVWPPPSHFGGTTERYHQ